MIEVVASGTIHANAYPSARTEVYSGTALTRVRVGDTDALLCAFRQGTAKMSPDGRVVLKTSSDGGTHWRPIDSPLAGPSVETIAPAGGGHQIAGPHLGSSPSGTTILAAARMTMARPGDRNWNDQASGIVDATGVFVRGRSGNWSGAEFVDGRRSNGEWAIPCGPPIEVSPGRWFAPAERHSMPDDSDWLSRYHAFSFVSDDDGETWQLHAPMANDPDQRCVYYDQHVALTASDRLLSLAWVHDVVVDQTLQARSSWSDDLGLTWSEPTDTGILGGPVAPVVLPDGRLLAVYPRRAEPAGVRACLSEDGGRTWLLDDEFVIWDERHRRVVGTRADKVPPPGETAALWDTMWGWTFGLPTPTVLADGTVMVAFYATDAGGSAAVRYVTLSV